jgi:class 3 adenylate cyclase
MTPIGRTDESGERDKIRRKLAILLGDVAHTTFLTDVVGDLLVTGALKKLFSRLSALESVHHGRVVKTFGDGFMAIFEEVVTAIGFAASLQKSLDTNPILVAEHRLMLRLSLHYGEVLSVNTSYGDDILGLAVNVVARINRCAQPGEVVITDAALEALPSDQQRSVIPRELVEVKGLNAPVQVSGIDPLMFQRCTE